MPTGDPDDGEIGDVDEFLGTLGEVEYDDVLLSLLGDGGNLDVPGDDVEQQLTNLLSGWRNDGDREPVRDEAIGQKHPQGGEWPSNTTGGTMSATDDAAALRAIQLPNGTIQQSMQELDNVLAQASSILGSSGTGLGDITSAVQEAKLQLDSAFSAMQQVESALETAAGGLTRG
jgi:hypothetical protein